jgi:hypothetical protein
MFPPVPAPAVILPLTLALPVTTNPVPVTTTTLALPIAEMLTLPFADGILTLLFPFANTPTKLPDVVLPEIHL